MGFAHTKDFPKKPELKTRWFVASYKQSVEALKTVSKQKNMELITQNDNYHEILFRSEKFRVVCIVTQQTPRNTAVDFSIECLGLDFGRSKKEVVSWYNLLAKQLQFKGYTS